MIKVGIAGARGLSTVMGLQAEEDVRITALCDLDEDLLRAQDENTLLRRQVEKLANASKIQNSFFGSASEIGRAAFD